MKKIGVGIGIIILNKENKILIGKRKGKHAPFFSIPGGILEIGETFEDGAKREVLEETGITVNKPTLIGITNNLNTYKKEGIHNISIIMISTEFTGEPKIIERDKCEGWFWVNPNQLPEPHFEASKIAVQCFLQAKFYITSVK